MAGGDSSGTTVAYELNGFETLTVGNLSGELTFSGQNASDVEKVVVTADSGNNASFYNMGGADLTFESIGETGNSYVSDNDGLGTLNYESTEDATSAEETNATFEFVKSREVGVNVGDNVNVTGGVTAGLAEDLTLNVGALNSSFNGVLDAGLTTNLTINSTGGNIEMKSGGNLASVESLTIDSDGKVDLKTAGDLNLGNINSINIIGDGGSSEALIGNMGDSGSENNISIIAEGLANGLTLGDISTQKDVDITADDLLGGIKDVGDISADDITINANQ